MKVELAQVLTRKLSVRMFRQRFSDQLHIIPFFLPFHKGTFNGLLTRGIADINFGSEFDPVTAVSTVVTDWMDCVHEGNHADGLRRPGGCTACA